MDIQTDMEAATEYKQRKRIRMLLRTHTYAHIHALTKETDVHACWRWMCTPMTAQIDKLLCLTIQRAVNLEAVPNNVTWSSSNPALPTYIYLYICIYVYLCVFAQPMHYLHKGLYSLNTKQERADKQALDAHPTTQCTHMHSCACRHSFIRTPPTQNRMLSEHKPNIATWHAALSA